LYVEDVGDAKRNLIVPFLPDVWRERREKIVLKSVGRAAGWPGLHRAEALAHWHSSCRRGTGPSLPDQLRVASEASQSSPQAKKFLPANTGEHTHGDPS
jgi:hypothetical protein